MGRSRKPIAVDLFSGCGGLSFGLKMAGYRVVAGLEVSPSAVKTYRSNHPGVRVFCEDICLTDAKQFRRALGLARKELDLLTACPPCQGFSRMTTKNRGPVAGDQRNDLLMQVNRFAEELLPKTVVLENVPGMLEDERFLRVEGGLKKLGYSLVFGIQDAADFQIPQRRKRAIVFAARGTEIALPGLPLPRRTVRDAIGGLPAPRKSSDPLQCSVPNHAPHVAALIRKIPKDGGSRASLDEKDQLPCHKKLRGFGDVYGRMRWDDVAPTITGSCTNPSKGRFLHPSQNRAITLREASLLQGFPLDYKFDLSHGRMRNAEMIGNAFPPGFGASHAFEVGNAVGLNVDGRFLEG